MPEKEKSEWLEKLEEASLTSRLRKKESLKRFNTWHIGGNADCLIDVVNIADLSYDGDLLEEAKLYAENIISYDPQLNQNKNLKDLLYIHERDTAIKTLNAG